MNTEFISDTFLGYMKRGGVLAIIVVVLLLFLDAYNAIKLDNIPYLKIGLWGYLILNAGIATPFHYLKEKGSPKCPKCNSVLKVEPSFYCDNCGKIEFKSKK